MLNLRRNKIYFVLFIFLLFAFELPVFSSEKVTSFSSITYTTISQNYTESQLYLWRLYESLVRNYEWNLSLHNQLYNYNKFLNLDFDILNIEFADSHSKGYYIIGGTIYVTSKTSTSLHTIPDDIFDILFLKDLYLPRKNFGYMFMFYDVNKFFSPVILVGYNFTWYDESVESIVEKLQGYWAAYWDYKYLDWRARVINGEKINFLDEEIYIHVKPLINPDKFNSTLQLIGMTNNISLSKKNKLYMYLGSRAYVDKYFNATQIAIDEGINYVFSYSETDFLRLVYPTLTWSKYPGITIYNYYDFYKLVYLIDWNLFVNSPFSVNQFKIFFKDFEDIFYAIKYLEYSIDLLNQYLIFGHVNDLFAPMYFNKKDGYIYSKVFGKIQTWTIDDKGNIYYPGQEVPLGFYRALAPNETYEVPEISNYTYASFNPYTGIIKTNGIVGGTKISDDIYFAGKLSVYYAKDETYVYLEYSKYSYKVLFITDNGNVTAYLIPNETIAIKGSVEKIIVNNIIIYNK